MTIIVPFFMVYSILAVVPVCSIIAVLAGHHRK